MPPTPEASPPGGRSDKLYAVHLATGIEANLEDMLKDESPPEAKASPPKSAPSVRFKALKALFSAKSSSKKAATGSLAPHVEAADDSMAGYTTQSHNSRSVPNLLLGTCDALSMETGNDLPPLDDFDPEDPWARFDRKRTSMKTRPSIADLSSFPNHYYDKKALAAKLRREGLEEVEDPSLNVLSEDAYYEYAEMWDTLAADLVVENTSANDPSEAALARTMNMLAGHGGQWDVEPKSSSSRRSRPLHRARSSAAVLSPTTSHFQIPDASDEPDSVHDELHTGPSDLDLAPSGFGNPSNFSQPVFKQKITPISDRNRDSWTRERPGLKIGSDRHVPAAHSSNDKDLPPVPPVSTTEVAFEHDHRSRTSIPLVSSEPSSPSDSTALGQSAQDRAPSHPAVTSFRKRASSVSQELKSTVLDTTTFHVDVRGSRRSRRRSKSSASPPTPVTEEEYIREAGSPDHPPVREHRRVSSDPHEMSLASPILPGAAPAQPQHRVAPTMPSSAPVASSEPEPIHMTRKGTDSAVPPTHLRAQSRAGANPDKSYTGSRAASTREAPTVAVSSVVPPPEPKAAENSGHRASPRSELEPGRKSRAKDAPTLSRASTSEQQPSRTSNDQHVAQRRDAPQGSKSSHNSAKTLDMHTKLQSSEDEGALLEARAGTKGKGNNQKADGHPVVRPHETRKRSKSSSNVLPVPRAQPAALPSADTDKPSAPSRPADVGHSERSARHAAPSKTPKTERPAKDTPITSEKGTLPKKPQNSTSAAAPPTTSAHQDDHADAERRRRRLKSSPSPTTNPALSTRAGSSKYYLVRVDAPAASAAR